MAALEKFIAASPNVFLITIPCKKMNTQGGMLEVNKNRSGLSILLKWQKFIRRYS